MNSKINTILAMVILELVLFSYFSADISKLQIQSSFQRKQQNQFWDDFESDQINPLYYIQTGEYSTIELSNSQSFSGLQSLYIESHNSSKNPQIIFRINWELDPIRSSLANISFQFITAKYFPFMILVIEDSLGRAFGIEYGNTERFWIYDPNFPNFISEDQSLFVNRNNFTWFSFNRNIQNEINRALTTEGSPFENFSLFKVISLPIYTDPIPTIFYIDDLCIIDLY